MILLKTLLDGIKIGLMGIFGTIIVVGGVIGGACLFMYLIMFPFGMLIAYGNSSYLWLYLLYAIVGGIISAFKKRF